MKTREITLCSLFAALMVVGAYISIPTPFVPITFQAFFACLAGVLLGSKLGAISQLVYVFIGLIGLPVFQGGNGGPTMFIHPTFGYIIGFIVAAYIIGKFTERKIPNLKNLSIGVILGLIIIYALGTIYFYLIMNFFLKKPMNFYTVIKLCVLPFILKDLILSEIAALIAFKTLPAIKKLCN